MYVCGRTRERKRLELNDARGKIGSEGCDRWRSLVTLVGAGKMRFEVKEVGCCC